MKLLFAFGLFVIIASVTSAKKNVVCYHGTWSVWRVSNGNFEVSNINPYLCTHLIYAYFGVHENGELRVINPYLDLVENWGKGNIKKFNDLKKINPELKTLASVGGWNEGSNKFSNVAKNPINRRRFIQTSIEFIKKHAFDGLAMDWEFPAQRDGDPKVDKTNFAIFIRELKEEFSKHNMLLTANVAPTEYLASISYDIPEISKHLDFINLMTYNFHGTWERIIGMNAPLYESPNDVTSFQKQLNINATVNYWLSQGAPAHKIILGVPLFGRTFTLENPNQNIVGSINVGPGHPGKYTQESGSLGYNEICEQFKNDPNNWSINWYESQRVPYAVRGNQWISYDDTKSIEYKVKYANENNLGGIMVWSIETDDFRGICGPKYPLMKTINTLLGRKVKDFVPVTEPPKTNPDTKQPSQEACKANGSFRNPENCAAFYVCFAGNRYNFKCPANLVFNTELKVCDYREHVQC